MDICGTHRRLVVSYYLKDDTANCCPATVTVAGNVRHKCVIIHDSINVFLCWVQTVYMYIVKYHNLQFPFGSTFNCTKATSRSQTIHVDSIIWIWVLFSYLVSCFYCWLNAAFYHWLGYIMAVGSLTSVPVFPRTSPLIPLANGLFHTWVSVPGFSSTIPLIPQANGLFHTWVSVPGFTSTIPLIPQANGLFHTWVSFLGFTSNIPLIPLANGLFHTWVSVPGFTSTILLIPLANGLFYTWVSVPGFTSTIPLIPQANGLFHTWVSSGACIKNVDCLDITL